MKPKLNKDGILTVFGMLLVAGTCVYFVYSLIKAMDAINQFIYGIAKGMGF
jgi:RsiW-degrading membrane proteinase PrsW (M82 family)